MGFSAVCSQTAVRDVPLAAVECTLYNIIKALQSQQTG